MNYVEADIEIINIENSDIITTSGNLGDNDCDTGKDPWD